MLAGILNKVFMDQAKTEERALDKAGACVIVDLAFHSPTIQKYMLDCRHEQKQILSAYPAGPDDSKGVVFGTARQLSDGCVRSACYLSHYDRVSD